MPTPYSAEDARAWLARCETALGARERRRWRSSSTASGELAAAITLWLHGKIGELGYWAAPAVRGRGYVPRAVQLRLSPGRFDELELPRIAARRRIPATSRRERVAEKSGFTREGVLRSWLEQRGERRDVTHAGRA